MIYNQHKSTNKKFLPISLFTNKFYSLKKKKIISSLQKHSKRAHRTGEKQIDANTCDDIWPTYVLKL